MEYPMVNGVDASDIEDEGSTEDGDYIRYKNGWQICIKESMILDATEDFYGDGTIHRSDSGDGERGTWDFPQSFISAPSVIALSKYVTRWVGGIRDISETQAIDIELLALSSSTDIDINLFAIGRWK